MKRIYQLFLGSDGDNQEETGKLNDSDELLKYHVMTNTRREKVAMMIRLKLVLKIINITLGFI